MLSNLLGAREYVAATRKTGPDDIWNSALAGFGTGALLGRLQGLVLLLSHYCCVLVIVFSAINHGELSICSSLLFLLYMLK